MRARALLSAVMAASLAGAVAGAGRPPAPSPASIMTSGAARQEKGYPFTPYDGRFQFVRIYFDAKRPASSGFRGGGRGYDCSRGGEPCWHHDYPAAELNLTALLNEITEARAHVGGNVFRASDPELHRFPLAWLAEPGFWTPDDEEVANIRSYLLKGGFIIFDDFGGAQLDHLLVQMQRIVPELQPMLLAGSEPIFHSFFDIAPENLQLHSYRARAGGERYIGYFEDNEPSKRQLAILNADNDIGEFIEYQETGFAPVDMTNEAYKLAVNYIVYALTH